MRKNCTGAVILEGYDVQTKEEFLLLVACRNAVTLMSLIIQWIRPGIGIWEQHVCVCVCEVYNGITAHGFQHGVVNHKCNFVDPNTGVKTNHVVVMWQQAKAKFKSMLGLTNCDIILDMS